MPVTVYFKNGGSTTSQAAVSAGPTFWSVPGAQTGSYRALELKDDQDRVIGHFMLDEVVGYFVHTGEGLHSV